LSSTSLSYDRTEYILDMVNIEAAVFWDQLLGIKIPHEERIA